MNFELAWGQKVSPLFRTEVIHICKDFSWSPARASDLMSCMAFETAETFSPSIRNAAGSGAVGLIQFMPRIAGYLGTTPEDLAAMTAEVQLQFVERYFRPYANRINSLSDCYMAILLPKYIGKPEDSILFSGGVSYRQNAGLDKNNDGVVTKAEATALVKAKLEKGMKFATQENWPT